MFHLLWEAIIGLIVGRWRSHHARKRPRWHFITMLIGVAGALLLRLSQPCGSLS